MTTKHKHPYSRLTCAEMKLVDLNEVPTDAQVENACDAINALGLAVYGPALERGELCTGGQDYGFGTITGRLILMRKAQTMLKMGITPENIDKPYAHLFGLGVKPLGDWYEMYCGMSPERWHGVGADECHPENWIEDGRLAPYSDATAT